MIREKQKHGFNFAGFFLILFVALDVTCRAALLREGTADMLSTNSLSSGDRTSSNTGASIGNPGTTLFWGAWSRLVKLMR